jgi:hypothetical protein
MLQRAHIDRMVAAKAATPSAARNFLKALKAMMAHCVANHMRDDDPTQGIRSAKIKTDGYPTWSEEHVAAFEARHPIGSRARWQWLCCCIPGNGALMFFGSGDRCAQWCAAHSTAKDQREVGNPGASRAAGNIRRGAWPASDLLDDSRRLTVLARRFRESIPRLV